MRPVVLALATLFASMPCVIDAAGQHGTEGPRSAAEAWPVRGLEPQIQVLIERGMSRSATFRRIVTDLNRTDVIVHVTRQTTSAGLRGALLHRVMESNGLRFLRVTVDPRGAEARVIALIAHELQHALEVARVPEVGRTLDIAAFFGKISDHPCRRSSCFETAAAVDVQEAVLRELR